MSARFAVVALVCALPIAGCGGSSSSTTATTAGRRGGFFQNAKVRACLAKQGVTLPNRRSGAGGPRPQGTNGAPPPTGRAPNGAARGRRFGGAGSARFAKLRKALQACGVTFRGGGPGGPPGQGAPPAQGTAPAGTQTS